jgi:hypothetical protein
MNRSLPENIRRKLMPDLEASQGFEGQYTRGDVTRPMTAIPTIPEWTSEDDSKAAIEQWTEIAFVVFVSTWAATGLGLPQQGDRFTVTLADGVSRTYALLPPKGRRPYDLAADGAHYTLRMKWVKA